MPSSPDGLSFHVLGRLEAYCDGVELDLGPRKQRALLALLLLNANRVVATERLIDDLWGDIAAEHRSCGASGLRGRAAQILR